MKPIFNTILFMIIIKKTVAAFTAVLVSKGILEEFNSWFYCQTINA